MPTLEEIGSIISGLVILAGLITLLLWGAGREDRKVYGLFRELANQLGLTLLTPKPKLISTGLFLPKASGKIDGITVTISTPTTQGIKRTRDYWTEIKVPVHNPKGHTLEISKSGLLSKIANAIGRARIELNDEVFDKELVLNGSDEAFARSVMKGPVRKQAWLAFSRRKAPGEVLLEGNFLVYREMERIKNARRRERIEFVAVLMKMMATEIGKLES